MLAHVNGEPVGDDRPAVVWAFTTQTAAGKRLAERLSRGEQPAVTDELLVEIREQWQAAGRPILHPHVHRDAVTFADGTTVIGARFLVDDPYSCDEPPTFGLYLDEHWAPPWDHAHLPWIDYDVPDAAELRAALEDVLDRARRGERVEVGCLGGHGRTGTALGVPCRADRNATRRGGRLGACRVLREGGRDGRAARVRRRIRSGPEQRLVATGDPSAVTLARCLLTPVAGRSCSAQPSASVATPNAEGLPDLGSHGPRAA
jgi:hypothetical protein